MAYDEGLAQRVREVLDEETILEEKKMFGGLCFMVNNHMCCGVLKDELMVRVGKDAYEQSLELPFARPMDFTGKPLAGMVYVAVEGLVEDDQLTEWINRGLRFIRTLPPKK